MNRRIALLIGIFICSVAFSRDFSLPKVPRRLKTQEERIDYICAKYWKHFNPRSNDPSEQIVVDFLTVAAMSSDGAADKGLKTFFKKFRAYPEKQAAVSETVDKYLYDSYSPMYDEELYRRYLKEENSPRSAFILDQMDNNKVGTSAADFTYYSKDGYKFNLSDNYRKSEYILIIFFDEDCGNCRAMFDELADSKTLMISGLTDGIKIVAVNLSADANDWFSMCSNLPEICEEAIIADQDFFDEGKYLFKSIPALYLLDKDGTVLIKDAIIPEIEYFINNIL